MVRACITHSLRTLSYNNSSMLELDKQAIITRPLWPLSLGVRCKKCIVSLATYNVSLILFQPMAFGWKRLIKTYLRHEREHGTVINGSTFLSLPVYAYTIKRIKIFGFGCQMDSDNRCSSECRWRILPTYHFGSCMHHLQLRNYQIEHFLYWYHSPAYCNWVKLALIPMIDGKSISIRYKWMFATWDDYLFHCYWNSIYSSVNWLST